VKSAIKYLLCLLAYYSGITFLYRLLFERTTALVLTYHRVLTESEAVDTLSQPGMIVTNTIFERQLEYLSKVYRIIPMVEMVDRLTAGRIDGKYCSITFDDGWRDVYANAFPLLKKHDLPAVVFLATGFVGTDRIFWPERVTRNLRSITELDKREYFDIAQLDADSADEIEAVTAAEHEMTRRQRTDNVIEKFKRLDSEIREKLLTLLEDRLSRIPPGESKARHVLDWEEIEEMRKQNISFGSHTVNHVILTEVPQAEAQVEIAQSKQALENKLGEEIGLFAYPNGDWNDEVKRMVEQAGYRASVTTMNRKNDGATDPFLIGRLNVHQGMSCSPRGKFSRAVFACEISGMLSRLRRVPGSEKDAGC